MKRLKYIEDKNEQLLEITKNKTENMKEITDFIKEPLILEVETLAEEIRIIQEDVNYKKFIIRGGNNITYNFSDYKTFKELFRNLYYKKMTINDAQRIQRKFNLDLLVFNNYIPRTQKCTELKNNLLDNAKNFCKGRKKLWKVLKTKYICT